MIEGGGFDSEVLGEHLGDVSHPIGQGKRQVLAKCAIVKHLREWCEWDILNILEMSTYQEELASISSVVHSLDHTRGALRGVQQVSRILYAESVTLNISTP